jgi:hypothetical protein
MKKSGSGIRLWKNLGSGINRNTGCKKIKNKNAKTLWKKQIFEWVFATIFYLG